MIGMNVSEFWEMTPRELNMTAEAHKKKKEERAKEEITLAYLNAMWTVQWLGKKSQQPKPLTQILDNLHKEKKVMTDEEMLEQVKRLNAIFGGTETTA